MVERSLRMRQALGSMPSTSNRSGTAVCASPRLLQQGVRRIRVVVQTALSGGDVHTEADQLLLRPVVDVSLQPAELPVLCRNGGRTRLRQLTHLAAKSVVGP